MVITADSAVPLYEGLSLGGRVSGLTPYTLYEFTVKACTLAGCLNTTVTFPSSRLVVLGERLSHGPAIMEIRNLYPGLWFSRLASWPPDVSRLAF